MGCLKLNIENSTLLRLFNGGNWVVSKKDENLYRYGYQGSEKDDEVKGQGNSYTTRFRQLDPRIGRWLSIDPKATAWESPYVSMGNNPIWYNDVLSDTIRATKEGFNLVNEGLTSTLGENNGFSFDKGKINYMKPDGVEYTSEQQGLVDRFTSLIRDERDVNINVVNFDEKFEVADGVSIDLQSIGLSAATSKDGSQVWLARNPQTVGKFPNPKYNPNDIYSKSEIPGWVNSPFHTRGVSALHEIGGHSFLRMYLPQLDNPTHLKMTEDFETQVRQFYRLKGSVSYKEFKKANKKGVSPWFLEGAAEKHLKNH